jgi:hypothetical protein
MARFAARRTPGRPNVGHGFRSKGVRPPYVARLPRLGALSLRSKLQNEFQVDRYAAFLRLASSRESTSATIPSMTV